MTTLMRRRIRILFTIIMPVALVAAVHAQEMPERAGRYHVKPPTILGTAFGLTVPQGRVGLREFWLAGPGGAVYFQTFTDQYFAIGAGADFSLLYFDERGFSARHPGVKIREKQNLILGNIYIEGTVMLLPTFQTRPYFSVQVGAELISQAVFREVISGVRRTYYDIGGKTRLAVGTSTGVVISLSRAVGIRGELKGVFVHNDRNVSVLVHARVGLQFRL